MNDGPPFSRWLGSGKRHQVCWAFSRGCGVDGTLFLLLNGPESCCKAVVIWKFLVSLNSSSAIKKEIAGLFM